jgi:hypothetical protein
MVSFNFQSAPLTRCLHVYDESEVANRYSLKTLEPDQSIFSMLEHCTSIYCKKVVRVCLDNEQPTELLVLIILLISVLLTASLYFPLLLRICSLLFGRIWHSLIPNKSKKMKTTNYLTIQDALRENKDGCWKTRRMRLIEKADKKNLNRRGNNKVLLIC